eukprot:1011471-Prymnesium_polylepis.1
MVSRPSTSFRSWRIARLALSPRLSGPTTRRKPLACCSEEPKRRAGWSRDHPAFLLPTGEAAQAWLLSAARWHTVAASPRKKLSRHESSPRPRRSA